MQNKIPSFLKIIEIIRFFKPEFFNKVTWFLLLSGVALTGTSLLEKILLVALDLKFQVRITDSSDAKVGLALIVIGLVYNICAQSIKYRHELAIKINTLSTDNQERKQHDMAILQRLFLELPYGNVQPIVEDAALRGINTKVSDLIERIARIHNTPPYQLHEEELEASRLEVILACGSFYESILQFLSHERGYPDDIVVPMYELKNNCPEAFYDLQRNVTSAGQNLLKSYTALICLCKAKNYYVVN